MAKENAIIQLENVSKIYGMGEEKVIALDKVNFSVRRNEYLSIMGPSGSGKTTLLDILSTMMKPTSGNVYIEGVNTTKMTNGDLASFRGMKIGFVFQTFHLLLRLTALENVMTPMWINGMPRKEREIRAKELLQSVGLKDRMTHKPNELSGGQKQRVSIARALAMDPPLIVADEPTGNLDTNSGQNVMEILDKLHKQEKRTVILVTHDKNVGKRAEQQIFIRDGRVEDEKKVGKIM
ncbi:MAG: ABC transporter ATP-binding protein [archaeon]